MLERACSFVLILSNELLSDVLRINICHVTLYLFDTLYYFNIPYYIYDVNFIYLTRVIFCTRRNKLKAFQKDLDNEQVG